MLVPLLLPKFKLCLSAFALPFSAPFRVRYVNKRAALQYRVQRVSSGKMSFAFWQRAMDDRLALAARVDALAAWLELPAVAGVVGATAPGAEVAASIGEIPLTQARPPLPSQPKTPLSSTCASTTTNTAPNPPITAWLH